MSRVDLQRMGRQDAENPWNELSSSILRLFINFVITDSLYQQLWHIFAPFKNMPSSFSLG